MKESFARYTRIVIASTIAVTGAAVAGPNIKFTQEDLKLPGKRGACFTLRDSESKKRGTWEENLPKLEKLKPYWNYSWGCDYIRAQEKHIKSEFVPMTWAARSSDRLSKKLEETVVPQIRRGKVKRLLAFNEPDGKEQANMTPEEALKYWPILEKLGVPLCSPSPIHADREWMKKFMDGVAKHNYRVDYVGVHSYYGANSEAFKKRLRKVYELNGKRPLLITEFAVADWNTKGDHKKNRTTPAEVLAFAKEVLPWMEEQDWILGYSWFSFEMHSPQGYTSALVDVDGSLTALGEYYASVTNKNPRGNQSIKADAAKKHLAKALQAAKNRKKK